MANTSIPLLSGEVHYWRLDPNSWRAALERVREMGIGTVATYACWEFHETAPGQYDFRGETDPRRNLTGYLDLLTEMGFWIIFRPGPYIYSEWKNNGVPDRAARLHRFDSEYLDMANHYMAAVTEAASSYLATRGGRIILWQADNEIDPWSHFYTEGLGLGNRRGMFHDFLRLSYRDVSALNTAWRTEYISIDDARAVCEMFPDDPVMMARYNDFRAFLHDYVKQVATCSVDGYRALGIDVPMLLNTYSGVGTQKWSDLEQIADLVGPDIYPSRELTLRGSGEHRHILEAMRYASSFSRLPYIPEYEAGIWHDWMEDVGVLPPNHYRLICLSALMSGAAGWNWYMLVNRDNWVQSPINEWGRTRPGLFAAFRQIATLYYQLDPTTLTRLTHTAVTFDALQRATQRPGQDLLHSLYTADIDYDFFDVSTSQSAVGSPYMASVSANQPTLLIYAGGQWLSESGQQRLIDYVEAGGHLVCIGAYPKLDEHLLPLNLLDIPAPDGVVGGLGKLHLGIFSTSVESTFAWNYTNPPGEAITVERLPTRTLPSEELLYQFSLQDGARYTVGFTVERGAGRLTVIGLHPTPALLLTLHNHFGVAITSYSQTADVNTGLFRRDDDFYLIATNSGNEAKSATISLTPTLFPNGTWHSEDLLTGLTSPILNPSQVSLSLARKNATILRLYRST